MLLYYDTKKINRDITSSEVTFFHWFIIPNNLIPIDNGYGILKEHEFTTM